MCTEIYEFMFTIYCTPLCMCAFIIRLSFVSVCLCKAATFKYLFCSDSDSLILHLALNVVMVGNISTGTYVSPAYCR